MQPRNQYVVMSHKNDDKFLLVSDAKKLGKHCFFNVNQIYTKINCKYYDIRCKLLKLIIQSNIDIRFEKNT